MLRNIGVYGGTAMRPDIVYSANEVCQSMRCLLDTHLKAAKGLHRYLKGPMDSGVTCRKFRHLTLVGFSARLGAVTWMTEEVQWVTAYI